MVDSTRYRVRGRGHLHDGLLAKHCFYPSALSMTIWLLTPALSNTTEPNVSLLLRLLLLDAGKQVNQPLLRVPRAETFEEPNVLLVTRHSGDELRT